MVDVRGPIAAALVRIHPDSDDDANQPETLEIRDSLKRMVRARKKLKLPEGMSQRWADYYIQASEVVETALKALLAKGQEQVGAAEFCDSVEPALTAIRESLVTENRESLKVKRG
jgi:hypothetical protein